MKHMTKAFPVAIFLAAALSAQGPFGVLTSGAPPDAASMVANKVQRLTALLTLTTAQANQATTIFTAAQAAITPLETALAGYQTSLQNAVKSNATATIDSVSAQIGATMGQITAARNKADAAFYAILTADQQTKLNARGTGMGRGMGRGGPHGPHN